MNSIICDACRGSPAHRIQFELDRRFGPLGDIELQYEYVDICLPCLMKRIACSCRVRASRSGMSLSRPSPALKTCGIIKNIPVLTLDDKPICNTKPRKNQYKNRKDYFMAKATDITTLGKVAEKVDAMAQNCF